MAISGDPSLLLDKFIAEMNVKSRRKVRSVAPEVYATFESYDWPGNVRELRNVLAYAFVIGDGERLMPGDLPAEVGKTAGWDVTFSDTNEIEAVFTNGGSGTGLYRTEFLHLTSATTPTEEDHFDAYRRALELSRGAPLVIRTLDLGADKFTQDHLADPERNPFLGLRSIRYCLRHPQLFKTQLRAILRASALGPIKVMFPLVSSVMELRQTHMIINDLREELEDDGIAFDPSLATGIMVETPAAALMTRVFANEVSFVSIGTNDLIQYTLAVDRGNEQVASLYSAANPAVLTLVKNVVRAARHAGIGASLCGEVAGNPLFTPLLIGFGLRSLSMSPVQIPVVKRVVRALDIERCETLARKVGSFDSDRQVLSYLRDELRRIDPEALVNAGAD